MGHEIDDLVETSYLRLDNAFRLMQKGTDRPSTLDLKRGLANALNVTIFNTPSRDFQSSSCLRPSSSRVRASSCELQHHHLNHVKAREPTIILAPRIYPFLIRRQSVSN